MGILPDWLGEGGFIAVAANPPAGITALEYARRPAGVSELAYSGLTRYPAAFVNCGYGNVLRVAGIEDASYLVTGHYPAGVTAVKYSTTGFPAPISNLSYQT